MLAENASHVFRLVTATACVSSYFLGFQFSAMSVLLTRLLPGPRYYMFYTSLFPLGAIAGVFVGRSVMNWKGRRAALIVGNLIGSIGCVACTAYANLYLLAVGRVICGIGTGIGNISAPFYIKEIIPVTVSSRYLLCFHLCITLGDFSPFFLFAGHASWEWWWRFIFALPLLPNAAQLILLLCFCTWDTPAFYYMDKTEDPTQALKVLGMIYKEELMQTLMNIDMEEERYSIAPN